MKHKLTQRVVLVLIACVACVLAFGATLAQADENAGSTGSNQLVVELAKNDNELSKLTAQVELYRVATASKDTRYDTYNYNFNDVDKGVTAFAKLGEGYNAALANAPEMNSSDWDSYWKTYWEGAAADAKDVVQNATQKPEPYSPDNKPYYSGDTITVPDDGIYLVIIHEVDGSHSSYSFAPQLVALPGKVDAQGQPVYNTSQGSWTNATDPATVVKLVAKPTVKPLTGSITIKKSVDSYYGDPATCTFRITGTTENGPYNNVVAVMLSPDNKWSATIDNIPAGYMYTVTEEDSGAQYKPAGSRDKPVEVRAGESTEVVVEFENIPNESGKQGYGIENHFVFKDGEWQPPIQRTINKNSNE